MRDRFDDYEEWYEEQYEDRPRRRPADENEDARPRSRRRREDPRHSGWGVASFVLSLVFGIGAFLMVVVAGVLTAQAGGEMEENSPEAMLVGLGIIGCLLGTIVGGVFGLIGVAQQDRKKVFAIVGLVFNAVVVLGLLGIMALGIAMG